MPLSRWIAEWPSPLGEADAERVLAGAERLYALLTEANRHFNLTRIESEEGFWSKHIADSLSLLMIYPELMDAAPALADIGCGAGFPSLVLALARPRWRITAIDSTGKKTAFVARAGEELGLDNLEVVTGRSRELNRKAEFRRRFDIVTARAVAPAATLASDADKFLRPGGRFIFYKTPGQLDAELASPELAALKLRWERSPAFELPGIAASRQFVRATV